MQWRSLAPRWSVVSAAAILVAAIAAAVVLAAGNSPDEPVLTAPAATNGTSSTPPPTQAHAAVTTTDPGAPSEVSPDALRLQIAQLAAELADTPVVVRSDNGQVQLTLADLGVSLDSDATYSAVAELRGVEGSTDAQWLALSGDPQLSERRYNIERPVARAVLANATELGATATFPSIVVVNDGLAVDLGQPGHIVDADAIVDEVKKGIARGYALIEVRAELQLSRPLEITPELQDAVNEAQARYGRGLVVTYEEEPHEITLETVAGWLILDSTVSPPAISFNSGAVGPYLEEAFAAQSDPVTAAAMAVVGGVPTVVAANGGTACCADNVDVVIEQALRERPENPVALPSRPAVSREEQAYLESLGITELVGTFTTKHTCCQSRVDNIQRFADLMRGVVVEPGQSLSLNGHVGRRTEEKGFVEGGFIERGVLIDDVGGGVSQFATTIFNALLHAGMDIDEYQTHSLYLSRYPYGLDPTISYPKPDLRFTNPTPYGVLIWPTYTDTSITVELYSTRNVAVTIGEPEEEMRGFCRRVSTERTRVFANGATDTDSFHAAYRPEQGRNCDGSRSVPRQCVDPLLESPLTPGGEDSSDETELELVDDGSERADGSIVVCPPLVCSEKPGERSSDLPRYPDDPCLGVDLNTLGDDEEAEDGSAEDDSGRDSGGAADPGNGDDTDGSDGDGAEPGNGDDIGDTSDEQVESDSA